MPNTCIVDLRHYLDASGALGEMPRPALHAALFFGSIVAWVAHQPGGRKERNSRRLPPQLGERRAPPLRSGLVVGAAPAAFRIGP